VSSSVLKAELSQLAGFIRQVSGLLLPQASNPTDIIKLTQRLRSEFRLANKNTRYTQRIGPILTAVFPGCLDGHTDYFRCCPVGHFDRWAD